MYLFTQLDPNLDTPGKVTEWPVGVSMRHFLVNWCGKAMPTVGDTIPRQVCLGCIRKLAVYAPESSVCLSLVSALVPSLNLLRVNYDLEE